MSDGVVIWKSRVRTWECDEMGHMNVAFYVLHAMEGVVSLAAELGMPRAFSPDAQATLMVREHYIRFRREAHAGAALTMTGGILEMGETEARLLMVIRHHSGEIAATFQTVVSHVTTGEGRPFPWSPQARERAQALKVTAPPEAEARSITLEPITEVQASGSRARELGLQLTGLGVLKAGETDAFGRMRPEIMMERISGSTFNAENGRPGTAKGGPSRVGGAALEYRLVYLAWPRLGDRMELWGGFPGGDVRFRKQIVWMIDPASGKPWGLCARVGVSLDLDTRKILTPSAEEIAAYETISVPGLTY